MAESPRFFDDLARLAQGALGAANSARAEAEASMRAWLERQMAEMDFVPREDFDTVADMARLAREENERLSARLDALEAELAGRSAPDQAARSEPEGE
ncbi:MAG: accessory factor UbiK family protein [Rhodothalassiaceae bacterium]